MAATVANLLKGIQDAGTGTGAKKSKKSSVPTIELGANQAGLIALVDHYANAAKREEEAAAERKLLEQVLVRVTDEHREAEGLAGNYSKSYKAEGSNASVTSSRSNRWTMADKEADVTEVMAELKDSLGGAFVDEMFKVEETLEVNTEDQALVREMLQTLLKAYPGDSEKVKRMFLRKRVVSVNGDLDVRQFTLDTEQRETLRKHWNQAKAGIKVEGDGASPSPEALGLEQELIDSLNKED